MEWVVKIVALFDYWDEDRIFQRYLLEIESTPAEG
jgi:hypothetical protein